MALMEQTQRRQEHDTDLVGATLKQGGYTLAVAESLTGGLLASAFARASGSSQWFRGGIVAYSSAVKYDLLDVPSGPVVSEAAAIAMARGAGRLLEADIAVAVTGVGGPDSQDGEPPGTVWAAIWPDQLGGAALFLLSGSPEDICEQACAKTIRLLRDRLELREPAPRHHGDYRLSDGRRARDKAGPAAHSRAGARRGPDPCEPGQSDDCRAVPHGPARAAATRLGVALRPGGPSR
jgi:nicotinamide-nucleotide amidase